MFARLVQLKRKKRGNFFINPHYIVCIEESSSEECYVIAAIPTNGWNSDKGFTVEEKIGDVISKMNAATATSPPQE